MDDAAHRLGPLFLQDAEGGFRRRPGVDHQRFPDGLRQANLGPEGSLLLIPRTQVVVPVESCLSDEAHRRVGHQHPEGSFRLRRPALRLVGMHTQAGLDAGNPLGKP